MCRTRHTKRRWLRHAAMVSVNVTSRLKPTAADGELLLHNIPLLIAMLNLRHELYQKNNKIETFSSVGRLLGKADCVLSSYLWVKYEQSFEDMWKYK